jgi:TRAP-type C4-dicarboxylate transport system permease small subunit
MKRAIIKASYILDRFCRITAVGFLAIMLILVLLQVVARYLFQSVPVWTEESARYCMVWAGLLGATVAFRADSEPRLIHPPHSGPRWKIVLATWIRSLCVVVFLGPVFYHSYTFLLRTFQRTSEALGISIMWIVIVVPLAIGIIFFHMLGKLIRFWTDPPLEKT